MFAILDPGGKVLKVYDLVKPLENNFDVDCSPYHGANSLHQLSGDRIAVSHLHNAPNGLAMLVVSDCPKAKLTLYKFHDVKNPKQWTSEDLLDKVMDDHFVPYLCKYNFKLGPQHLLTLPRVDGDNTVMGRRFYDHVNDKLTPARACTKDEPKLHTQFWADFRPKLDDKICKIYL